MCDTKSDRPQCLTGFQTGCPNPLLSIVVPVYNVRNFLEVCLDSLVSQIGVVAELILVDDGSTDGSREICLRYANEYANVFCLSKENGGLSSARNAGVCASRGEFVSFVDSDDWVEDSYVRTIVEELTSENSDNVDILSFQYDLVFPDNQAYRFTIAPTAELFDADVALEKTLTSESYGGVVTVCRVYRRILFDRYGVWFPEGRIHEDCFTTYRLISKARKVRYVPSILYHYRQRRGSIIHTPKLEGARDKIAAVDICLCAIKREMPWLSEAVENTYVRWLIQAANEACKVGAFPDVSHEISSRMQIVHPFGNHWLSISYKFLWMILRSFPGFYPALFSATYRWKRKGLQRA